MNCKNCNSELPATAKFCAVCGTPVEQQPVAPTVVCRSCGSAVAEGVKFCTVCGTAMNAPAAAQPVVPTAPVPPVAPVPPAAPVAPQPVEAVAPVAAPQPVEPVAPVAAPQPVEPVAPVAAPQPVEPVAPVAAPQPVEPVVPVAAPQPVEPVAPVAAPQPVEPVAPVAAPQPVEPVAPVAAPQPMNDVMPQPIAPVAPSAPSGIEMDVAGLDMDAAAVAAVKPVKKKGKLGLWIGLGAVGVVAAAAAVGGLFFRGPIANLFMGDAKYATMVEGKVFEAVTETDPEVIEEANAFVSDYFSTVLTTFQSANSEDFSSADDVESAFAGIDLEDIISTYNAAFVETYNADGITMNLNADLQLTDDAKSDLGATDDIIDIINGSELTLSYQAATDALGLEISAVDPDGFELSGRGVVTKDGTVALMLPFATDKCIKMTFDTEGNVTSAEEVDFDIDVTEVQRIGSEMANIYLKYYEMADITIEKGSMKAAKVEAEGRLITAEMDEDLLGDMIEEMITFMVEDDYFMDKFTEFAELIGEEFSEDELKEDLETEMEELKDDINFTVEIRTLVDNNSNLLAKSYGMDIEDEGEASFTFVGGESEQGFVLVIDDMDALTVKAVQENETNGKMDITIEDADTEIKASVVYENVQTTEYLNTQVATGKYDIEIKEEDKVMNIAVETSVDGSKLKNSFSLEFEEMGTIALDIETFPESRGLTDIPADAVDFTEADSWTEDESKANAQYILDALNEIMDKCEAKPDSAFANLIGDAVGDGIIYFEEQLTPKVDSEQLTMMAEGISDLMDQLDSVYSENSAYVSDELFDECSDVYDELNDCYYDVAYEYEMEQSEYDEIVADVNELSNKVTELCDRIRAEAEAAQEQQAASDGDLVGMWTAYMIEGFGEQMTAEEAEFVMNVMFYDNGTYMWNWDGEVTSGTWTVADGIVTLVEEEWYYEFNYVDGQLTYLTEGITIYLNK